ncbi:hypothetical protein EDD15DRAFT_1337183 [Pisolithus albus]|nr:hypothetical protein EDD15DRAFT_1337183 [Pisolithus albus]
MLLTLTRPRTSSLEVVPDVPPKGPIQQLSYCSLPSSSSTSDESSLSQSSCDTSSEAVICSLATRPPTPTPPRPSPRHAVRSHDRRPKTAPPSAIGTSLSRGPFSVEESNGGGGQPVVVFRRWRVGSQRGFVATRVAPPLHPPPTRPLPFPPAHHLHRRRPSSGSLHSNTAHSNHVASQPPMPILPIFPARDSSSTSSSFSTSNSATLPPTHSNDTTAMLAVPLLHPLAAQQGPPTKREQPRHSNQSAQPISASSNNPSPHKHRSKFTLPLISGSSHPALALVPFPDQHTPSSTSPGASYIPVPSSPLPSPPRSLQYSYATLSSGTFPAPNTHISQDSLPDSSPLTSMHCEPRSVPFRLRGPLGHPLTGLPIAAAVEIHQPPSSVTPRRRPFSVHNKRAKSALRNSQSPHSVAFSDGEDEDQRPKAIGVHLDKPRRTDPGTSYSPCSSSVLNPHGGLDSSRRRHHPFRPDTVPYPRNYERAILDL